MDWLKDLGGWVSGIGSAIGGWFGAKSTEDAANKQVEGQQQINQQQIDLAQKSMDWQEKMSNSAHQREVTDLRAAGLNPILSARYAGASTPVPILPNINNPYGGYAGNMASSAQFAANALNSMPDIMLKASQAQAALASSALSMSAARKTDEETRKVKGGQAANWLGTDAFESVKQLTKGAADAIWNAAKSAKRGIEDIGSQAGEWSARNAYSANNASLSVQRRGFKF